jgi:broad specificity phosphatase PhoE
MPDRMGGCEVRYLVRHADAGEKRLWNGPDDDRPLSSAGHRQAEGLVALLADRPISEILSSPALRCWQTVQPLAERRRLPVRADVALAVEAEVDRAGDQVVDTSADDVVLCSHGELIRPLLGRLRELGAPISDEEALPKGSVLLLEVDDGVVAGATYLPPHQEAVPPWEVDETG